MSLAVTQGETWGKLIPFKMKCDFQKFKMFAAAACGDLQGVCRAESEPGLALLRQIHSPIGIQVSSTRGCEEFDLCINFGLLCNHYDFWSSEEGAPVLFLKN